MDHLGRLGRGARGEVVALDQGGAQPAAGGVEGHAGPGDAAADDEDVEGLARRAARARRPGRSPPPCGPGGPSPGQPATAPAGPDPSARAVRRGFRQTIVNKQSLVITGARAQSRRADRAVPRQRPQGDGPAPVHLPGPPGRRDPPDGRVGLRGRPRRDGDDLAQDRLPDPERAGRAGRDRRPRPRHRHRPVRPQRRPVPPPPGLPVVRQGARPPRDFTGLHGARRRRPGLRGGRRRGRVPRAVRPSAGRPRAAEPTRTLADGQSPTTL